MQPMSLESAAACVRGHADMPSEYNTHQRWPCRVTGRPEYEVTEIEHFHFSDFQAEYDTLAYGHKRHGFVYADYL